MMKNVVVIFALILAVVCSQACAQKKSDTASTKKASTTSKLAIATMEPSSISSSKRGRADSDATSKPSDKTNRVTPVELSTEKSAENSEPAQKPVSRSRGDSDLTIEQQKKIKSMLRQTIKPFLAAELTDEQRQKAEEIFGKAVKDYVVKRSDALITDDLQKKHATAVKAMTTSSKTKDKSGDKSSPAKSAKSSREQVKEAFVEAGFSEDQVKVFKATQASLNKAHREFGKLLSEEQIGCLPDALQQSVGGENK